MTSKLCDCTVLRLKAKVSFLLVLIAFEYHKHHTGQKIILLNKSYTVIQWNNPVSLLSREPG